MLEGKNKIYIGNLDYSVTEEEIKNFFDQKGVSAKALEIITDKYTGRSKGFGFAVVESEEEVEKAIEALNGQEFKGRTLNISKAREPKERGPRREGFGFGRERRPRY